MTAKTYDRQTAKFLAMVGENMPKLSGDVMQGWIQNPKAVQKALRNAFCPFEVKVWKTIKLGLGTGLKTAEEFSRALHNGGFRLSDWASDILGKAAFVAATEETEIDLVKVTVAEIGFEEGARSDQIYERAKKLGLVICPPEVGPQLRLQYKDQPNDEWILVGMEPILDSDVSPSVFSVSGLDWLGGYWGYSSYVWGPGRQWVFCRPRK